MAEEFVIASSRLRLPHCFVGIFRSSGNSFGDKPGVESIGEVMVLGKISTRISTRVEVLVDKIGSRYLIHQSSIFFPNREDYHHSVRAGIRLPFLASHSLSKSNS